jgi:signal transduction histidine kinase
MKPPYNPPPVEPDHLYSISQVVARSTNWKASLDEIARLVRPLFIFDNLAVFYTLSGTTNIDVFYARATGRGKNAEADAAWGETIAAEVVASQTRVLQVPENDPTIDRLERPYLLGIPLFAGNQILGALVFIRFGSPEFTEDSLGFASFVAEQVAILLERERLRQTFDQLEAQSQTIQLQDDFIATISHELRSPLGFIKGYSTTLLRPDAHWDEPTQHEFLKIIDLETDHLLKLIENLLDSARLQSGQLRMDFQTIRVEALVNDAIARTQMHYPGVKVNLMVHPHVTQIVGDPARLAQVVENLMTNAAKYASGSPIDITINPAAGGVELRVKDTGPGIPEEYQKFLFQRFFRSPTLAPNIHGTGLGLFICKQIVLAHNGTIRFESTSGVGTTFIVFLPHQP